MLVCVAVQCGFVHTNRAPAASEIYSIPLSQNEYTGPPLAHVLNPNSVIESTRSMIVAAYAATRIDLGGSATYIYCKRMVVLPRLALSCTPLGLRRDRTVLCSPRKRYLVKQLALVILQTP
jgi:hypothetical protein